MAKVFTDSYVMSLRPAQGQQGWREVADAGCRGLHLKLSHRGEKVWAIRHVIGGRRRRHIVGGYPAVSLAEARKRATQYLSASRDGMTAIEMDARTCGMAMTLAAAHAEYVDAMASTLKPNTIYLKKGMFRRHVNLVLGTRLIRTVRKADLVDMIIKVKRHSPIQANRVFAEVMALLRWCEEKGYLDGIPSIRKKVIATKERPRRRSLTDRELAEVWENAGKIGPLTRDFLRLLMLTGQRRDEVRGMTWAEVNLDEAIWVIPPDRYKTGIRHVVPLSDPALEILRKRWAPDARGFVLKKAGQDKPFNGAASAMRRLREHLTFAEAFRLHDLRRTVRTGLARLGVDDLTAEMVLGHQPQGIQRVYDVHDRLKERRAALSAWADHVLLVATGLPGERMVA